jgi:hypothetical protein
MQEPLLEVDLIPAHCHHLADSETMAVTQENEGSVAMAVPAPSAGSGDELVNLLRCKMLPRSPFAVRDAPSGVTFPFSGCWPRLTNEAEDGRART